MWDTDNYMQASGASGTGPPPPRKSLKLRPHHVRELLTQLN
jgi:hypothetical protein